MAAAPTAGAFDVPPALLEDRNVIVVSMNYRLGVLGFFARADSIGDELSGESIESRCA